MAVWFESLLGVLGLFLIWLFNLPAQAPLLGDLPDNLRAVGVGVLATVPLVGAAFGMLASSWRPFVRLRLVVLRYVVPWFRNESLGSLFLVAAAAGLGEELLFRGALQTGLIVWWGESSTWAAVIVSSLLFGVLHWATATYAVLATVMGCILGGLLVATDNILVPVTTHTLYDFFVLARLVQLAQRPRDRGGVRDVSRGPGD